MSGDSDPEQASLARMRSIISTHPSKFQKPCPSCGNKNDWSISFFEDDNSVVALSILDKKEWATKAHGAVIAVVCGNCGYVNIYDRKKFFEYVERKKPNEALQENAE